MKDSIRKMLIAIAVIVVMVAAFSIMNLTKVENYHDKYDGYDLATDIEGVNREGTYTGYLEQHADATFPKEDITVDLSSCSTSGDSEIYKDYEGETEALYTGDESKVTWEIEIPKSGFYNIYMEYATVESKGVRIERALYINGELPFEGARSMTFSRMWTDGGEKIKDNQGNEIRPSQVETYGWQNAYCRDDMGYITEPYQFYFDKGTNTISLEAINEPFILRKLTLKAINEKTKYSEYIVEQPTVEPNQIALNYIQKIQGEDAVVRSDSSLYAKYDKSSASTQPYSVTKTVLNYSGGDAWKSAGQWIEWDFEVPEDGYYNITVKGRQNYERGSVSCRRVYIDGEVPFDEMNSVEFIYDSDWRLMTLADEKGSAYQFYLKAGTHSVRLEVTLGATGAILETMEDSSYRLNQMYRKILVYTGATPDQNRDYNLDLIYPEVLEAMSLESKRLYKIVDDTVTYTGQKSDKIATAQTLAQQLEKFVDKPYKLSIGFTSFKDNITALGTAILTMSETKLDVDYIVVSGVDAKITPDKANIAQKAFHEIKSFIASFLVDYNSVGNVYGKNEEGVVKVWIVTGRDQGTILKTMIDDTFSPMSGININVEIVDAAALLSAVVAGRGPDVVLSIGSDQPVNYALRGAAEDLTQFDDWQDVFDEYYESAYKSYEYNDGIYAVPESQTFNALFYRTDIMEELGLDVPQTWEDVISMLPTLQGNNMEIGVPDPTAALLPDLSIFYSILYQNGGDVYNEKGTSTIVDSEIGAEAFAMYTKFYTDYGTPTNYDFVSRFRSGQMPIGIANFTIYNTLVVSAPEIRSLWKFTLIPGTNRIDEDGKEYLDRSVFTNGTCTMMLKSDNELRKKNTWEFMKWWASADAQVRFGREQEALLGSSARYPAANLEAFSQLSWSAENAAVLKEQRASAVGFREIAGGYYTGRHIVNAVRKVINKNIDPREVIIDYAITIDEELIKKQKEFGLTIE